MVLLCDVMWAPPVGHTTSESPYDAREQLRAESQEFADWLKFSHWRLP